MATGLPSPQGLYDPSLEHDSCGVGFIVDLKGRKSHQLVRDGLRALVNLDHRGACGCENNTGDGAGLLIQIPHELLSERCKPLGIVLGEPGTYGVGAFFTSPDPAQQTFGMEIFEKIVAEEGQVFLGWRHCLPTTQRWGPAPGRRAAHVPRPRRPRTARAGRRRLRAQALRDPQAVRDRDRGIRARRSQVLLLLQPVVPDPGLQGDAHAQPGCGLLRRRPGRSAACQRDLHVPLAVLHQHVPELATGPSLPDDLAQRRDQHAARQHQLDAGPRGPLRLAALRAGRPREDQADHPRGALRHGLPGQRHRAAGPVGLQPAARDDDAHPRGVGQSRDRCPRSRKTSTSTTAA